MTILKYCFKYQSFSSVTFIIDYISDMASGRMGTRNPIFMYPESAQVETRLFFIFCQIFAIFNDFSKF